MAMDDDTVGERWKSLFRGPKTRSLRLRCTKPGAKTGLLQRRAMAMDDRLESKDKDLSFPFCWPTAPGF